MEFEEGRFARVELERDPKLELGFLFSVLGHAIIAYLFFYGVRWGGDFGEPKIYSVTLEGGKMLGGLSQVPKKDDKAPLAPPKKVEAPPAPKVETKKEEPKKEEEKKEQPPDAEISLKKKEEEKPKPQEKKEEKAKEKNRNKEIYLKSGKALMLFTFLI